MGVYVGVKRIKALKMTRAEYNRYRGWKLPADEDGECGGFLVEHLGAEPNHPSHEGYISWSPIKVFEKEYRLVTAMNFGTALEALKLGERVSRAGWSGKGMWLVLVKGTEGKSVDVKQGSAYERAGLSQVCISPRIDMYTADGAIQPGWLASQTDMLADDWVVVGSSDGA